MEKMFLFSNSPFTRTLKEQLCGTPGVASGVLMTETLPGGPGA